jgi:hypothetical protein
MFASGIKKIGIREIELASIVTKHISPRIKSRYRNLSFDSDEFYVSTARAILSSNLSLDTLLEAYSCFYKFQSIINTKNPILTLNKGMVENLRDFSKTAKLGELAQGVTWLVSQNILSYPFIIDYHGFLHNKGLQTTSMDKSPDYILSKKTNTSQISLIESKCQYKQGNKSSKSKLKKALEQCKVGANFINGLPSKYQVNKYYGLCLNIKDEQSIFSSEVDFVDPESESENRDVPSDDIIRYHYASWFLLYCDMENFSKLKSDKPIARKQRMYSLFNYNELSYYVYQGALSVTFMTPKEVLFMPQELRKYSFCIREEVFECLQEKRSFNDLKLLGNQNEIVDGSIFFMDGTALIRR